MKLNDYFKEAHNWWAKKIDDKDEADFAALLDAKSQAERGAALRKIYWLGIYGIAPEFLVPRPAAAIIEVNTKFLADSKVLVKDDSGEVWKYMVMSDTPPVLISAKLLNVSLIENKILLNVELYDTTKKVVLYVDNAELFCQLLCSKSRKVSIDGKEGGVLDFQPKKDFLPNRLNPYFLIYQMSLLPTQWNFIEISMWESLAPGQRSIEIELDSEPVSDSIRINCLPVAGLFEECTSYFEGDIASKYEIFDVIELNKHGKEKTELSGAIIDRNVLRLPVKDGLCSAKLLCIAGGRGFSSGDFSLVLACQNEEGLLFEYERLLGLYGKSIFLGEAANLVNDITKLYAPKAGKIELSISLTGGIKKGSHWRVTCPKYIVTLTLKNFSTIGYLLAWGLTFQKLCDVTRMCDIKIVTPYGAFFISDEGTW